MLLRRFSLVNFIWPPGQGTGALMGASQSLTLLVADHEGPRKGVTSPRESESHRYRSWARPDSPAKGAWRRAPASGGHADGAPGCDRINHGVGWFVLFEMSRRTGETSCGETGGILLVGLPSRSNQRSCRVGIGDDQRGLPRVHRNLWNDADVGEPVVPEKTVTVPA